MVHLELACLTYSCILHRACQLLVLHVWTLQPAIISVISSAGILDFKIRLNASSDMNPVFPGSKILKSLRYYSRLESKSE